jgi:hypothetical protein
MNEELQFILDQAAKDGKTQEEMEAIARVYLSNYASKADSTGEKPLGRTLGEAAPAETYKLEPTGAYQGGEFVEPQEGAGIGDYTIAGMAAANRGFYKLAGAAMKTFGAGEEWIGGKLGIEGRGLVGQLGDASDQFVDDMNPRDPRVNETFQQVGEGLGQGVGMMLTGGGSRVAALAPTGVQGTSLIAATGRALSPLKSPGAALGGAMTAAPEWEEAKKAGLSDDEAMVVMLKNYAVGQTEILPLERLAKFLNKETKNGLVDYLKFSGTNGVTEALQETMQQYLTNKVAEGSYDPERDPLTGLAQSAKVGGLVGAILPGVMGAPGALRGSGKAKASSESTAVPTPIAAAKPVTPAVPLTPEQEFTNLATSIKTLVSTPAPGGTPKKGKKGTTPTVTVPTVTVAPELVTPITAPQTPVVAPTGMTNPPIPGPGFIAPQYTNTPALDNAQIVPPGTTVPLSVAPTPTAQPTTAVAPQAVTPPPAVTPTTSKVYHQGIPKTSNHMQVLLDETGNPVVQGSLEDVENFKKDNGISEDIVNYVDLDKSNPESLINKFTGGTTPISGSKSEQRQLAETPTKKFWVVGSDKTGYKVVDKTPTGKNRREPFDSREAAERGLAQLQSDNSYAKSEKPAVKRGRPAKVKQGETQVKRARPVEVKSEQDETATYSQQYVTAKNHHSPAAQIARLQKFIERVSKSRYPEAHKSLVAKAQKDIESLNKQREEKTEVVEKRKSKKTAATDKAKAETEVVGALDTKLSETETKIQALKEQVKTEDKAETKTEIEKLSREKAAYKEQRAEAKQELAEAKTEEEVKMVKEKWALSEAEMAEKVEKAAQKAEQKQKGKEQNKQLDEIALNFKHAKEKFEGKKREQQLLEQFNEARLDAWKAKKGEKNISMADAVKKGFKPTTAERMEVHANSQDVKDLETRLTKDKENQQKRDRDAKKKAASPTVRKMVSGLNESTQNNVTVEEVEESAGDIVRKEWSERRAITEEELDQRIAASVPNIGAWGPIFDMMKQVIKAAHAGRKLRFLIGKNNEMDGVVVQDNDSTYLILNDVTTLRRTPHHEFIHLFEFSLGWLRATHSAKTGEKITQPWDNLNTLFKAFAATTSKQLEGIKTALSSQTSINYSDAVLAMTPEQQRLVYMMVNAQNSSHAEYEYTVTSTGNASVAEIMNTITLWQEQLNRKVLGDTEIKTDIYGLNDANEMLAEAMSNPFFAGFMASVGINGKTVASPKTSLFVKLMDLVGNIVNKTIKHINKVTNLDLPTVKDINSTYLGYLIREMDNSLSTVNYMIEEGATVSNAVLAATKRTAHAMAKTPSGTSATPPKTKKAKSQSSLIGKQIVDLAIKQDVKSEAEFKQLVTRLEKEIGQKLSPTAKGAAMRSFKSYLNNLAMVGKLKQLIKDEMALKVTRKSNTSNRIDMEPNLSLALQDVLDLDIDKLNRKQKSALVRTTLALLDPASKPGKQRAAAAFIRRQSAAQETAQISKPEHSFANFNKVFAPFTDFRTMLTYMAKFGEKLAPKINKVFHDYLARGEREALTQLKSSMTTLEEIIQRNDMSEESLNKSFFYGILMREMTNRAGEELTMEQKIEMMEESLRNKKSAIEKGDFKKETVKDVEKAMTVLNQVSKAILDGKEALSKGEREYYEASRGILDSYLPAIRNTHEMVRGKEFYAEGKYMPLVTQGSDKTAETHGDDLSQVLEATDLKKMDNLAAKVSPFTNKRVGGKAIFYDTNAHTVMNRYLHATLMDVALAYRVRKLNAMLHGKNLDQLRNTMGNNNVALITDALKRGLEQATTTGYDLHLLNEILRDAKNLLQSAKLGTNLAPLSQYGAMLPATLTKTNLKSFSKALAFQYKLWASARSNDPAKRQLYETFTSAMEGDSANMALRDYWWEKFVSSEDKAKKGFKHKAKRFSDKLDKITVTGALSAADKHAAQLTWMAKMIEQGADLEKPFDWTKDQVAAADLATESLQNVNSKMFAPSVLQVKDDSSFLRAATLYSFKSFAMHNMMQAWTAAPHVFKSKEARKTMASVFASAFAYEIAANGIAGAFGWAAESILGALGYDMGDDDEKEGEEPPKGWKKWLTNSVYSMFLGGFDNATDALARWAVNQGVMPRIFGEKDKRGNLKFDPMKDSPLMGPKEFKEVPWAGLGVFRDPGELLGGLAEQAFAVGNDQKGLSAAEKYRLGTLLLTEGTSMNPFIPLRGDVVRFLRAMRKEHKGTDEVQKSFRRQNTIRNRKHTKNRLQFQNWLFPDENPGK